MEALLFPVSLVLVWVFAMGVVIVIPLVQLRLHPVP